MDFATPDQVRHQTLMRLKDYFEALARQAPLLLILEDLHWADDLSFDLISLLMDSLPTTPLMLLCVYRPEQEHRVWQLSSQAQRKCLDRFTELRLKQLTPHESRRLVEELLSIDDLPESVKATILRKSEGNPFFIEEVIRSLIDGDLVYREGDRWRARAEVSDLNVPDTIQSVVMSRVDRLPAEAKQALQCAAVIGRLFKYRLLEHLAQQERDLDQHISEFESRDLVYEERTIPELEYAFKHAFTQEATYQGILAQQRRAFHHQAAQGIERLYRERLEEYYEELAYHYEKSGDGEKAVEYLLKAGERAKRNYANETAIGHFQRALEVMEQNGMERKDWKLEALRGLGEVYHGMGKPAEAVGAFESTIALAKEMKLPGHQLVRLYSGISETLFWQSRYDEMIRYGEMGLELLGDDTECLEAALMNCRIAYGNHNKGNLGKTREYIHKNMAFIKRLAYSAELRAPYDHIVYVVAFQDRDLEAAWEWSKALETLAGEHHDLVALGGVWWYQGLILSLKGDWKNALSSTQKSLEMCKRIGDVKHDSLCYGSIAGILFGSGKVSEAEEPARVALKMAEQVGDPSNIAWGHARLGRLAMCQHRWEEALSHYQKCLEGFESIGVGGPGRIAGAHFSLGTAYLKKGALHHARQSFEAVVDRGIETQGVDLLVDGLWGLEATHLASGAPEAFIDFCRDFRAKHADALENLSLRRWYLEPAQPADQFPHLTLTDEFVGATLASPSGMQQAASLQSDWTWVDEFSDCAYRILESGGVELSAANGRDFNGLNVSAPRFMRTVSGDFAAEVCISQASDDKPWMGGLLIPQDKDNFLRFDVGVNGENEMRLHGYVDGKQQVVGRGILQDPKGFQNPSDLMLRLERLGNDFSAYCSADGEKWYTCGTMTLPLNDPIQLGICAIGMIDRTIYCGAYPDGTATVFQNFRLWTPPVGRSSSPS